ncbi:hypothetical protein AX15_003006 [Amanita polypyramis BW_CC]|nr:hypothetical protein AX15_003006 [Amanita polypyramis BW_CC]
MEIVLILSLVAAHDALVDPSHPLHVDGVSGVQMYLGQLHSGETRLLFSSAQVDYVRYWLHAMGFVYKNGGTAATASDGKNVSPNVRTIIPVPVGGNDGNPNASTSTASGSLLAYLSKYPHVRQAFYKPRSSFYPASLGLHQDGQAEVDEGRDQVGVRVRSLAGRGRAALISAGLRGVAAYGPCTLGMNPNGMSGSGSGPGTGAAAAGPLSATSAGVASAAQMRQTNVFSLVERFTFKPNPPPMLPAEIQC